MASQTEGIYDYWGAWDSKLTRNDLSRSLEKIRGCASVLEMRQGIDRKTGEISPMRLHAGNFCKQPAICPVCAGRLQDRRKQSWEEPIKWAAKRHKYAYMVTATVRPRETWAATLNHLRESLSRMRRKGQKRKNGASDGEWGKFRAVLGKIEFKRGRGGDFNVHWHGLVFTDEQIDFRVYRQDLKKRGELVPIETILDGSKVIPVSKITKEWYESTERDSYNFRIDPLLMLDKHRKKGMSLDESIFEQSREVLKYSTKFDSRPKAGQEALFAKDFIGIKDASFNRRLFSTGGEFYGVATEVYEDDRYRASDRPLYFRSGFAFADGVGGYSEPVSVSGPVFPLMECNETGSGLRRDENRTQGNFRRLRANVLANRDAVRGGGNLEAVRFDWKIYGDDWIAGAKGITPYKTKEMIFEVPAAVASAPMKLEVWEKWIDDIQVASMAARRSIRDEYRAKFEAEPDLVVNARKADNEKRSLKERSLWYQEEVVRAFLSTLHQTGSMRDQGYSYPEALFAGHRRRHESPP